ncbi:unnamed protein product, partial [Ixodes hexagonus]
SKGEVFLCYWASWSHYRKGNGKFSVEEIDPSPCTHLIYAYAKLENGSIAPFDPHLDTQTHGIYRKFNALKRTKPSLKTLISIGGWNEGSRSFSKMASKDQERRTFANSVVAFLDQHGFDGVDIDWRSPTEREGSPDDRTNFVLLLQVRIACDFDDCSIIFLISRTKACFATPGHRPATHRRVATPPLRTSGPEHLTLHRPRSSRGVRGEASPKYESSVDTWISKGADVSKLVLGMQLYGRTFTLARSDDNGLMAPALGPGRLGPITKEGGSLGYNEICSLISSPGWKMTRNPNVNAPFAVNGDQWIGYEDAESLRAKV